MGDDELSKAYDNTVEQYLFSRTESTGLTGFDNREVEQPTMFKLVPSDLKGTVLLDVGCGPGIHVKEYVKRGATATGIDFSSKMILRARKYCPEGTFEFGNAYQLEFQNESFDIVTSSFVVDHFEHLEKAVQEIKRILKPNGLFVFSVQHPVRYMFRDSEKDVFTPSNSYFDRQAYCHNISGTGKDFPSFPRTIQDYFQTISKNGFVLEDFLENEPKESWKEKYPELNENKYKIPLLCFFKWKKK
ncbi:class I SAM-dependent methyltransferase [Candidatus Woesearchaeota archaeon]|nr:class I SAM-dependent methyltransferase [Candidatus Woesearchaeota archaeon]